MGEPSDYVLDSNQEIWIHGLPDLIRIKNKIYKTIWFCLLLANAGLLLYSLRTTWIQYVYQDVTVDVTVTVPETFPPILLCESLWIDERAALELNLNEQEKQHIYAIHALAHQDAYRSHTGLNTRINHSFHQMLNGWTLNNIINRLYPIQSTDISAAINKPFPCYLNNTIKHTAYGPCIKFPFYDRIPKLAIVHSRARIRIGGRKKNNILTLYFGSETDSFLPANGVMVSDSSALLELTLEKVSRKATVQKKCMSDGNMQTWSACIIDCFNKHVCTGKCKLYRPLSNQTASDICLSDSYNSCLHKLSTPKSDAKCISQCSYPCKSSKFWINKIRSNTNEIVIKLKNPIASLSVQEHDALPISVFLSRIGGNFGAFFGVSIMAIIQIVYLGICSMHGLKNSFRRRHSNGFWAAAWTKFAEIDIHGIIYVMEAASKYSAMLWMTAIATGFGFMTLELVDLGHTYATGETSSNILLQSDRPPTEFTYCPWYVSGKKLSQKIIKMNQFEFVGRKRSDHFLLSGINITGQNICHECPNTFDFIHSFMVGSVDHAVSLNRNKNRKLLLENGTLEIQQILNYYNISFIDFLKRISYDTTEIVHDIRIGGVSIKSYTAVKEIRPYGICYRINITGGYTDFQIQHYPISFELYSPQSKNMIRFDPTCYFGYEQPLFQRNEFKCVSGRHFDVKVRYKLLDQVSTKENQCKLDITFVDTELCMYQCGLSTNPKCCKPFLPAVYNEPLHNISNMCTLLSHPLDSCLFTYSLSDEVLQKCSNICPTPCRITVVDLMPTVSELRGNASSDNIQVDVHLATSIDNLAITVFYPYDVYALFSNLGGTFGLYFGTSVLAIAQIILLPCSVYFDSRNKN